MKVFFIALAIILFIQWKDAPKEAIFAAIVVTVVGSFVFHFETTISFLGSLFGRSSPEEIQDTENGSDMFVKALTYKSETELVEMSENIRKNESVYVSNALTLVESEIAKRNSSN